MRTTSRYWIGCALLTLVGCGQDVYESRLATTSAYFEHVNKLNANLSAQASNLGVVAVRTPLQFGNVSDDPETEDTDERQPTYLGELLPGLAAAYQADVAVDIDGQMEPRPAFIYVLTNEQRMRDRASGDTSVDPLKFTDDVVDTLCSVFRVFLVEGATGDGSEPNVRFNEQSPRAALQGQMQYEPTKIYTGIRFQPPEPLPSFDVPMEYDLYMVSGRGDVQAAILTIVPELARPDERLRERFKMMRETLIVRERGGSSNAESTGGSTPSGGGALTF